MPKHIGDLLAIYCLAISITAMAPVQPSYAQASVSDSAKHISPPNNHPDLMAVAGDTSVMPAHTLAPYPDSAPDPDDADSGLNNEHLIGSSIGILVIAGLILLYKRRDPFQSSELN